jgi:HSP20 family protein
MPNVTVQKTNNPTGLPVFEEINQRFEAIRKRAFEFFEGRGAEFGRELDDWLKAEREVLGTPAAELTEKDGAYQVQVALPGFEAKDIEVTATPTDIAIRAEAKQETKKEENGKVLWTEFGSQQVFRRVPLPEATDATKIEAKLENGILRIIAPKAAAKAPVQVAAEAPPGQKIPVAA